MEFFEFNVVAWHTNDNQAYVMVQTSPVGGMRRPILVPMNIDEAHALSQCTISDFFKGEGGFSKRPATSVGSFLRLFCLRPFSLILFEVLNASPRRMDCG
jgi:hypothetical protein